MDDTSTAVRPDPRPGRPPARRGRPPRGEALSRNALVDAAVALVREDGPDALSTGRLAQRVGITQSGFYAHFRNLDACLDAIAERLETEVRRPIADGMAALRAADPADPDALTLYFETLFDLVVERAVLRDLFLPYRGDRSEVGQRLATCEANLVDDLTEHLAAIVRPVGDGRATCRTLAHMLIEQSFTVLLAWQREEIARGAATRLLAEQTARLGASAHRAGLVEAPPAP